MDSQKKKDFRDESLPLEQRVEALLKEMTLEEKVFQLSYDAASIPRLGVPAYNYWNEALHGVARAGVATVFPQAIGLAATFHPELVGEVGAVISEEGRAKYNEFQRQGDSGIYKGLTYWSPNINLFRDPRWGRGHETYGEDPWLSGTLGTAFVRGVQGDDPRYLKAAACAKHFAVHSGPELGRHGFDSKVEQRELFDTYLPAFEACVKEGQVEAVMAAYNAVNGEPCVASPTLQQEILRERWGFKGHVVSDCGAIADLYLAHHTADTPAQAAAQALKNGCDLNCGGVYKQLLVSYQQGLVSEEDIDRALRRVLRTRFRLGMFDDPAHVPYSSIPYERVGCAEHRQISRTAARESLVLLKNDGVLPLKKDCRLAVIGPNADSRRALLGNYNGTPAESYTVLEGLRKYLGDGAPLLYAQGSDLFDPQSDISDYAPLSEAIAAAQHSDAVLLCLGLDATVEGEEGDAFNATAGGDRLSIELPDAQQRLLEAVTAVGKPVIVLLMCGSAVALGYAQEHAAAVIDAFYPGEQGGLAVADLLYGEYSPSGRLPVTFYHSTEDLPDFHDYSMRGRTYRYIGKEPLYPFGYGLSYTTFVYEPLACELMEARIGEPVSFEVTVRNAGGMDSLEHIQVYVTAESPSVTAPHCALKALYTQCISAGGETTVTITLDAAAFSLVGEDGARFVEAGDYLVCVGGRQPDERSRALTGQEIRTLRVRLTGDKRILPN